MKKAPNKKSSITRNTRLGLMAGGTFASLSLSALHAQELPALVPAPQVAISGCPACPGDQGSGPAYGVTPPMIGDLFTNPVFIAHGPPTPPRTGGVGAGGGKIAENESPQPLDRAYVTFNYFDNVVPRFYQGEGVSRVDVYREVLGIEKTFLDGDASVGIRVPYFTFDAEAGAGPGGTSSGFAGLDAIVKYAVINNRESGNVLSVGAELSLPPESSTLGLFNSGGQPGPSIATLQPFVGYIWNQTAWYVHGFSSLSVPLDDRAQTVLLNDIGVGYWLYRNGEACGLLTGIVPTAELHVNTPLAHGVVVDSVDLTQGLIFELGHRAWVTVGVSENVTGPKTYNVEGLVHVNVRF